jgi:hypothetical protein
MPETARMFFGSLDEAHPPREAGAVDDCAVILPGDEYIVKGWILPTDPGDPAVTMEISDGETRWTLPINRRRVDVEREHHTQQRVGFEGKIDLGERPGKRTLSFTAITDRTRRLDLDMAEIFRASAPLEPLAGNCGGAAQGRFRRVEEVGRLPMPYGMTSRRIARPEFGMYVKGWIIGDATGTDGETEIVIALEGRTVAHTYRTRSTVDGEPTMLGLTRALRTGFEAVLDVRGLPAGLYRISALLRSRDGTSLNRGPESHFAIAPAVPDPAPQYLPLRATVASCEFSELGPLDVLRGVPIAVAGLVEDPIGAPCGEVYVQIDDQVPLPIASTRADAPHRAHFGGVADTDLSPGVHRLAVLLLDASASGWHVLTERPFHVQ